MRISLNNIIVTQKNMDVSEGKAIELGDKIKGKILSIQVDSLMLALEDNTTLRAKVQEPNRYQVGDWVNLKVTDDQSQVPKAVETSSERLDEPKGVLTKLNLPLTEENIKAVQAVKDMGIPLTKDHVVEVSKYAKMAVKIVEQLPELFKDDGQLTASEKTVLDKTAVEMKLPEVKHIKSVDLKALVLHLIKEGVPEKEVEKLTSEKVSVDRPDVGGGQKVKTESLPLNKLPGDDLLAKVMKPLTALMKFDKPATIENFNHANHLLLESEHVVEKVKYLVELLPKEMNELETLIKSIKPSLFKNKEKVVEFFKSIETALSTIEEQVLEPKAKEVATQLLSSLKFMQTPQEDVVYFQMPIHVNQELTQLNVLYKKEEQGKKGLTAHQGKILIVLNTHHLKKVQALIAVKQKKVHVDFKVSDEGVAELIKSQQSVLEKWLEPYEAKVDVKTETQPSIHEFFEEDQHHSFSVRV